MTIKIGQPQAFTEQGLKDQQEDRLYPPISQLTPDNRCFVLCDGMGGHEQGEVAAEIVSKTLYQSLTATLPKDNVLTIDWFNKSLKAAYNDLNKMSYHSERRPGTTLTCTILGTNGILAAHIGDSRIYLMRPGRGIIYRSKDHSLVNQLIDAGELSEKDAINFPHKNVITRAMQPGLERQYAAEIHILTDVKAGDYLFMCCDGILEQLSDDKLNEIISADTDAATKLDDIYSICFGKTRDNFTCYLIPIIEVQELPYPTPVKYPTDTTTAASPNQNKPFEVSPQRINVYGNGDKHAESPRQNSVQGQTHKKLSGTLIATLSAIATLLIVSIIYLIFKPAPDEELNNKPKIETSDDPKFDEPIQEGYKDKNKDIAPDNNDEENIENIENRLVETISESDNNNIRENTLINNFLSFYKDQKDTDKANIKKFLGTGNPEQLGTFNHPLNKFLNENKYKMVDIANNKNLRNKILNAISKSSENSTGTIARQVTQGLSATTPVSPNR